MLQRSFSWLLLVVAACPGVAQAQKMSYAVALIPADLRENADAVRRFRHIEYEVKSPSDVTLRFSEVVTILTNEASDEAILQVGYDKQSKVTDLEAVAYDAQGREIKKYKSKDFADVAAFDGFSLYRDDRVKGLKVSAPSLPLTVAFSYTVHYKGFLAFYPFQAYTNYHLAVERDEYVLRAPVDYGLRYKLLNGATEPQKQSDGALFWQFKNLPALTPEPYGPALRDLTPTVLVAPNRIAYDGSEGDISTWENLGKWNWDLLQGRDQLPPATVARVRELVADAPTVEEKVCRVYQFLQSRTRYVSVQLGIGGFQPFTAQEVDETGYGDCKALSNYTRALLAAAGVPSVYAVVGAADTKIRHPDFCSFGQTNHVILAVPNDADTLWLECTSYRQPCESQGDFTSNRLALLVTPEGGKLVPTKHYTLKDNVLAENFKIILNADGSASGTAQLEGKGLQYEALAPLLHLKGQEASDWLASHFPILNGRPGKFEAGKAPGAVSTLQSEFTLSKMATVQGERLFFPVCPVSGLAVEKSSGPRRSSIVLEQDRTWNDTFEYQLPADARVDFVPTPKTVSSVFGHYTRQVTQEGQTLKVTRQFALRAGTYPAEKWKEFTDFLKLVNAGDGEKVVLVKGKS